MSWTNPTLWASRWMAPMQPSAIPRALSYAFPIFCALCSDLKFEISDFQSADRAHEIPGIRRSRGIGLDRDVEDSPTPTPALPRTGEGRRNP